ncbi:pentatricopeptide repeat-containing protein At5g48910-like [Prosopis cineraria]|uniref:pentatricopeptide repeat-containing protein At5g48910-like n=1 Tax=Prosopis cineraria TaxID=364024 RepID=UPI002410A19D|nr:pentatricopeptide repeat-containing protein At5g48910-like [Prosopis cineraria]
MLYSLMLFCLEDLRGIEFSVPSVLRACGRSSAFREGNQIFGHVLKIHLWLDPFVANSLVRMWLELGETELARSVFDRMPVRDLISWNSLITGYLRAGEIEFARELFERMPERDLVSCNAMIDGYAKQGMYKLAEDIFTTMKVKDLVTWTTMISAHVLNQCPKKALYLFREMLSEGIRPDAPAIISVLSAIADLGFVEEGKWIHTYISANKIERCSRFIGSALINMYSKCGQIEHAYHVFSSISHQRNIGDWNSMISGFAIHGLGHEAIKLFLDMERAALEPDDITFLGLLSACNHGGLMNEGLSYFETMQAKYKIIPKIQHYGCIVDLLGRSGHLEESLEIIYDMPMEPDVLIWKAILSASIKHNNFKIGQIAALRAMDLAPEDSSCYVLLSNLYAKLGWWDDVARVRTVMKKRGVRKIPGCSSIFVGGKVHQFLIGKAIDVENNQNILSMIEEVISKLKLEGYEPDFNQVLLDLGDNEKECHLALHSEKMALAFGLLTTSHGIPIHIVKNLRICCDCHSFMRLVSKIYNRRIIVRDQNRFHRFENGYCSCKDHW